jgi:glyoxylase-like metal-dependent hydrolase (beta-lactamase superfamily II)
MTAPSSDSSGPAQAGLVVSGVGVDPHGVHLIDTDYVRPGLDASHLVVEGGRAAFVDTGPAPARPRLLAALEALGIAPEAVDWVLLTHVHLDHAGGAGALLERLPNARLAVHPRGAAHLIDPSRLVAATRAVYGEAAYARLYGTIQAVPAERVVTPADGEVLSLSGRRLRCLYTPGHALHHVAYVDEAHRAVFTGDTFGISYRDFDVDGRPFILPTTTPTQFDPPQLLASIDRVLAEQPEAVYLTHFGRVTDVARLGRDLKATIEAFVQIARRHAGDDARAAAIRQDLSDYIDAALDRHGDRHDPATRHRLLEGDHTLNADGLVAWLARVGA